MKSHEFFRKFGRRGRGWFSWQVPLLTNHLACPRNVTKKDNKLTLDAGSLIYNDYLDATINANFRFL